MTEGLSPRNPNEGKKTYSIIHWRTGEPKMEWCSCLITTRSNIVTVALWTKDVGWTSFPYKKIHDVIAWCPITDIKPYKEENTKGVTALRVKKEFIMLSSPKAIMNQFGFKYDKGKSFEANCLDFLREKEEGGELYALWNAMHPDEMIRCLSKEETT